MDAAVEASIESIRAAAAAGTPLRIRGGEDLKTLYLSTASDKRPADELALYPHSGCVFSMRVEVPGLPVNFFID
jgi:hypothetical protein